MVLAYHSMFTTYGFLLSNDSRGIWSDFVRSFEHPGRTIEKIIGHLNARATQQLTAEGPNPMSRFASPDGTCPSVWVQHGWNVFQNSDDEVARSIDYDNRNPERMGLPRQHWEFVRTRNP